MEIRSAQVPAEDIEELTSEAAAKLLHVSRTHLNTLADTGVLGLGLTGRIEGGHRRLSKAHVLRYLGETQDRQFQGLEQMIRTTEVLGLYEEEAKASRAAWAQEKSRVAPRLTRLRLKRRR